MRRIVATLQQADASSLVLFDEIAAGTDPQEEQRSPGRFWSVFWRAVHSVS
jgi:dsDNA-specific endonuclease/ATPase MutS2